MGNLRWLTLAALLLSAGVALGKDARIEADPFLNFVVGDLGLRVSPATSTAGQSVAGFFSDLADVWAKYGKETIIKTAQDNPAVFFATCARLIGPEVKLTIEQSLPGNLSMEDWQIMREIVEAVRQALPDAADRRPGAVLEHVLDALRQAQGRTIDRVENDLFIHSRLTR